MTKEEQKEYNHKYYIENKSRRSEYYAKRRDKTNEYSRKYYAQKKQRLADLEKENAELKEKYNKVDIIGYDALKNLTKAENIIRELLFHLTNDTFYVTFETREQSVERARQFLIRR